MLQVHTSQRLDQIEGRLRMAAEHHGGSVLAMTHVGQMPGSGETPQSPEALTFTVGFTEMYAELLRAEVRFAVFLPVRIAAWAKGEGATLETVSPREWRRMLHRPDLDPLAVSLEELLRRVMEEAAKRQPQTFDAALATEDLVNMRAAVPQRIDRHGTKIEELAGTGVHDAAGG